MDERRKAELRDLRGLIQHPGWIVFSRDAEEHLESLEKNTLDVAKSMEDLAYRKGIRDTLRVILSYETALNAEEASEDDDTV